MTCPLSTGKPGQRVDRVHCETLWGFLEFKISILSIEGLIHDELLCERAYSILCFVTHGYIRGRLHDKPVDRLPDCIAVPLLQLSDMLGTRPLCTYCSSVLFNFRLLDVNQPFTLEYLSFP